MRRFVAACILVTFVALGVAYIKSAEAVEERGKAESLAATVSLWQAKYAEADIRASRIPDTVRVAVNRVQTLRDTLDIADTIQVKEYIRVTDTLRVACLLCVAALDSLRVTSAGTINALSSERDFYQQLAHDRKNNGKWAERTWVIALIGGAAFGAWIRGQ